MPHSWSSSTSVCVEVIIGLNKINKINSLRKILSQGIQLMNVGNVFGYRALQMGIASMMPPSSYLNVTGGNSEVSGYHGMIKATNVSILMKSLS